MRMKYLHRYVSIWDENRYEAFYGYCDAYHLTGWTAGPFLKYRPQMEAVRIDMFIDQRANEYLTADSIYRQNSAMESISGLLPEFYNRDSLCYPVQRSHGFG